MKSHNRAGCACCCCCCSRRVLLVIATPLCLLAYTCLASLWRSILFNSQSDWRAQLLEEYRRQHNSSTHVPIQLQHRIISADPLTWVVDDFLSEAECDYLVEAHRGVLTSCVPGMPEPLVHLLGPWAAWGSIRVCQEFLGSLISREDPGNQLLAAIEARMDALVARRRLEPTDATDMDWQLVRYRRGGKFREHRDEGVWGEASPLTMMVYLNGVDGGETRFPHADGGEGLTVRPRKGRLLVWSSCGPPHPTLPGVAASSLASTHYGAPPATGDKWILNRFYDQEELRCPVVTPDFSVPQKYLI